MDLGSYYYGVAGVYHHQPVYVYPTPSPGGYRRGGRRRQQRTPAGIHHASKHQHKHSNAYHHQAHKSHKYKTKGEYTQQHQSRTRRGGRRTRRVDARPVEAYAVVEPAFREEAFLASDASVPRWFKTMQACGLTVQGLEPNDEDGYPVVLPTKQAVYILPTAANCEKASTYVPRDDAQRSALDQHDDVVCKPVDEAAAVAALEADDDASDARSVASENDAGADDASVSSSSTIKSTFSTKLLTKLQSFDDTPANRDIDDESTLPSDHLLDFLEEDELQDDMAAITLADHLLLEGRQ